MADFSFSTFRQTNKMLIRQFTSKVASNVANVVRSWGLLTHGTTSAAVQRKVLRCVSSPFLVKLPANFCGLSLFLSTQSQHHPRPQVMTDHVSVAGLKIRSLARASGHLDRAETREAHRVAEACKEMMEVGVRSFVASADGFPCSRTTSSDGTPVTVTHKVAAELGHHGSVLFTGAGKRAMSSR